MFFILKKKLNYSVRPKILFYSVVFFGFRCPDFWSHSDDSYTIGICGISAFMWYLVCAVEYFGNVDVVVSVPWTLWSADFAQFSSVCAGHRMCTGESPSAARWRSFGTIPLYRPTLTAAPRRLCTRRPTLEKLHKYVGTQRCLVTQVTVHISDFCRACVSVMCTPVYRGVFICHVLGPYHTQLKLQTK